MLAVRTVEGEAQVVDVPDPSGAGVRLRVRAAGICGSDLHLLSWNLPVTMGHEFGGLLDDDTPVAIQPVVFCGTCDRCVAGDHQLCRHIGETILGVSLDGGMAEEVVVDERCLVPLPVGLDVAASNLVEPIGISLHAVNGIGIEGGERVLVVGAGTIGLTAVIAAQSKGATVDVVARHPYQFDAAEALGAGTDPSGEYDAVIEAAGTSSALDAAIGWARPGARVSIPGSYWHGLQLEQAQAWCMKELSVLPSTYYSHHHGEREIDIAAKLIADRPEIVDTLITHRFALEDAAEAFRVAADRQSGAIKVVLEP